MFLRHVAVKETAQKFIFLMVAMKSLTSKGHLRKSHSRNRKHRSTEREMSYLKSHSLFLGILRLKFRTSDSNSPIVYNEVLSSYIQFPALSLTAHVWKVHWPKVITDVSGDINWTGDK